MQPYVFPYIGYFQLIRAVDHFVFYDDVNFIKRGWINRNRITSRGSDMMFTLPVQGGSQNQRICDVACGADAKWTKKFLTQLQHEYRRAPMYATVAALIEGVMQGAEGRPVSEVAVDSVLSVMDYLDLPMTLLRASAQMPATADLKRAERLIAITSQLGGKRYVNLPGGMALYRPEPFAQHKIELAFIFDRSGPYAQFNHPFVPKLSIIDVLMHNSPDQARALCDQFEVIAARDCTYPAESTSDGHPV